jgi:hypothetical protein
MEVGLVCLCNAIAFFLLARAEISSASAEKALSVCLILTLVCYFARPDGIVVMCAPLLLLTYGCFKEFGLRRMIRPMAIGIVAIAAVLTHLVFRKLYYGEFVPNTFTLKVMHISLAQRLTNGLGFITVFLKYYWLLIAAALAALGVLRKSRLLAVALIAELVILVVYQIYAGGDPWPFWRQLTPGLVTISILISAGLTIAVGELVSGSYVMRRRPAVMAVIVISPFGVFLSNWQFYAEMLLRVPPYQAIDMENNVRTAFALREVLLPSALVAPFWAGAIPYFWNGPAHDPLGKSDKRIAQMPGKRLPAWNGMNGVPGHNKYDLDYSIAALRPDYIQYWKWGNQDFSAYVKDHYVEIRYGNLFACLLRNSPRVRWESVEITGDCVQR